MREDGMLKKAGLAKLRSFWRDAGGNAAIEFAILGPVLALMLMGTVELGRALSTDRHFAGAVFTTGDLVAREEYIGDSSSDAQGNLDAMMKSIPHLLRPYNPSPLKLAIYSVKVSANDPSKGKVEWSYRFNGMRVQGNCSDYPLPGNTVAPGGSVIVVDGEYQYNPLLGNFIPGLGNSPWKEKSFHTPRNACVDYVKGDNCISHC